VPEGALGVVVEASLEDLLQKVPESARERTNQFGFFHKRKKEKERRGKFEMPSAHKV